MKVYLNTKTLETYDTLPEKDLYVIEVEYVFLHIAKKLLSLGYPYYKETINKVYIHDKYCGRISIHMHAEFIPLSDPEITTEIIERNIITISKTFEFGKNDSESFHNFIDAINYLEEYFNRYSKINRMEYIANLSLPNGIPLGNDIYYLNSFAVRSDAFINEFKYILRDEIDPNIHNPIMQKHESIMIDDSVLDENHIYRKIYDDFLSIVYPSDNNIDWNKLHNVMSISETLIEVFASTIELFIMDDSKNVLKTYSKIAIIIWIYNTLYHIKYSSFISSRPLHVFDLIHKIQNCLLRKFASTYN